MSEQGEIFKVSIEDRIKAAMVRYIGRETKHRRRNTMQSNFPVYPEIERLRALSSRRGGWQSR